MSGQSSESASAGDTPRVDVGPMGMYLFIASLGMLFAGSIAIYLVLRSQNQPWPPPGFPTLPRVLWGSTLAILLTSATIQSALGAIRRGELGVTQRALAATFLLGLTFLALQSAAWYDVAQQIARTQLSGQFIKLFYVLTALHAVHVLGGLGPLVVVIRRAFAGRYSAAYHPGIRYSAIYWHFLDAVWCVLFVVVYLM